jgi:hypothetical protein
MHKDKDLLPHQKGITTALHDLTKGNHKAGTKYAKYYMFPENIKHIDSGACRVLLPSTSATRSYTWMATCALLPYCTTPRR